MNKYILILALLISGNTYAACTLTDGTVVNNCQQESTDANTLITWNMPSTYTNGNVLPIEEIAGTKVNITGLPTILVLNNNDTSLYTYLPRGQYEVTISQYTVAGKDGETSGAIPFKIKPNIPKHPTTYIIMVN